MNKLLQTISRRVTLLCLACQCFFGFSAQADIQVQLGQNFSGSDNTESGITPADGNGAVGPLHFVEFINGDFAIYAKTNGLRIRKITSAQFWANAGITISVDAATSDPRVIYDPASQRWFASQVDLNTTAADPTTYANNFLIAISDTADPTHSWHGKSFVADPDTGYFADFPTLGVDANALYISGDMFMDQNTSVGPSLWSFPKADLLLNTTPAVITNATWYGVMTYAERGAILQPATCVDGSSSGDLLATGDIFGGNTIIASKASNGATTNASLDPGTTINVPAYAIPFDPTQPDGTSTLADNDARFSARIYTVGGVIFAAHSVEINSRAAIRWYRVDATNHTLIESGNITDTNLDLFYPSIAATLNGVIVISCNGSSISHPISSFAFAGQTVNGVTTFGRPILLKAGTVPDYHDLNEQFGGAQESRWGDYSATTPDPADPSRFWAIQMLPRDSTTWMTQITEIIVTPQLSLASAAPGVNLSWPLFAANYQLQSTTNLPGGWSPILQSPTTNSDNFSLSVPTSAGQQFFRLAAPR